MVGDLFTVGAGEFGVGTGACATGVAVVATVGAVVVAAILLVAQNKMARKS